VGNINNLQRIQQYIQQSYIPIAGGILFILIVGFLLLGILYGMPKKTRISGVFALKGTIPKNSTITLFARDIQSNSAFFPVSTGLAAAGLSIWQYNGSLGKSYEIKAGLVENGRVTWYSNTIIVKAPAFNKVLSFTLPATAKSDLVMTSAILSSPTPTRTPMKAVTSPTPTVTPTPTATSSGTIIASNTTQASISGTIQFTGQALLNTRIVIFQRVTGTQNYQVAVDNLSPVDGTTWTWSNGSKAVTYDMFAVLKQKQSNGTEMDLAYSGVFDATAPVSTVKLSITSPSSLTAPAPNISVSCNNLNGSTLNWAANILFQTISGAQSYWYEIGTTDGGTDLANQTQNATNTVTQILSQPLKNGITYYARYAYAAVSHLNSGSNQFSPFSSPTVQMKCTQ